MKPSDINLNRVVNNFYSYSYSYSTLFSPDKIVKMKALKMSLNKKHPNDVVAVMMTKTILLVPQDVQIYAKLNKSTSVCCILLVVNK